MTDWDLIQAFNKTKSNKAFAALSERYADLVYSVSLREVGDTTLAEDTTQAVFLLLAHKAGSFRRGIVLASWLFRTARLASRDAMRRERRRLVREQRAYDMAQQDACDADASTATWTRIEPYLNDAIVGLREPEMKVVFLRLIQGLSLAETGTALGITEEAARKRTVRAIEKLRSRLAKAGLPISGTVLAALVSERSVHASPAALTQRVAAILSGSDASLRSQLIYQGAIRVMKVLKLQAALIGVGIVAVVAVSTFGIVKAISKPAGMAAGMGVPIRGSSPLFIVPMPPTGPENAASGLVEKFVEARAAGNLPAAEATMNPFMASGETPAVVASQARRLESRGFLTSEYPSGAANDALLYDYKNTLGYLFRVLGPTKSDPNKVLVEACRPGTPPAFTTVVIGTSADPSAGGQIRVSSAVGGWANIESMDTNQVANCLNLNQVSDAILRYAHSHSERLPDADRWMDEISPYLQGNGTLRAPQSVYDFSYAYNRNLSGLTIRQIPSPKTSVLVFNSTLNKRNAADVGKSLQRPGFDWNASPEAGEYTPADRGNDFIFADGHVDWLPDSARPQFTVD